VSVLQRLLRAKSAISTADCGYIGLSDIGIVCWSTIKILKSVENNEKVILFHSIRNLRDDCQKLDHLVSKSPLELEVSVLRGNSQ